MPRENLQDRIDALPKLGGTIYLEARAYEQRSMLNIRNRPNVRIVGAGLGTRIIFFPKSTWPLLIDMTGAVACGLEQLRVLASKQHTPDYGLVLARNGGRASAGRHQFTGLRWEAAANRYNVASLGSESNTWTHTQLLNAAPGGGNLLIARDNPGVKSLFGGVYGGSNVQHLFLNCFWKVSGRTGTEINIDIRAATSWLQILGGSMANKPLRIGRTWDYSHADVGGCAGIKIGTLNDRRPCDHIVIDGLQAETWGARDAIWIVGRTRHLGVRHCWLPALEQPIRVDYPPEDAAIEHNSESGGRAKYEVTP